MKGLDLMSYLPIHRIFGLPLAALLKVRAENGAKQAAAESRTPAPAIKKQSRLLTYKELQSLKGISYRRQHLDRLEKEGTFPIRIKIGARVYWYEHEIDEWIQGKANARPNKRH